jgi:1-deoxy-D-xylulose-5-phosphate reductoisomerase
MGQKAHPLGDADRCAQPPQLDDGSEGDHRFGHLANKGLEVIEAHHLFAIGPDAIKVVVHPQSIVHGMVHYTDGSVLAQLGMPDMRTPIAAALAWPNRYAAPQVDRLDLAMLGQLDFEPPDLDRFPMLGLAFDAMREGGAGPAVQRSQ